MPRTTAASFVASPGETTLIGAISLVLWTTILFKPRHLPLFLIYRLTSDNPATEKLSGALRGSGISG